MSHWWDFFGGRGRKPRVQRLQVPRRISAPEVLSRVTPSVLTIVPDEPSWLPNIYGSTTIREILQGYFQPCLLPDSMSESQLYLSDEIYNVYPIGLFKDVVGQAQIYLKTYSAESMDCDNFAASAYGYIHGVMGKATFGLFWIVGKDLSWGHALNGCVAWYQNESQFWFYEPQTHKFWRGGRDKYYLVFGVM